jgi:hypothetical protein
LLESPLQALKTVNQNKEIYYLLMDAILSKMFKLNNCLDSDTMNGAKATALKDFMRRASTLMKCFDELIGGHHEPVK